MVLFCQMDVSGRTEGDPAAALLTRNILRYAAAWQPPARRGVKYRGDSAGRRYLEAAGVDVPERGEKIAAFGLTAEEAGTLAPGVTLEMREYIGGYFEPFGPESPFAGISPADLFNRDPRNVLLVTGGAELEGGGVLAAAAGGGVVFIQLAPWHFDYSGGRMNAKRTFRNFARMTARLMGNLGAEMRTPLLGRFAAQAGEDEKRWLSGLYMDVPEEWDDPYRFFRW
jgi:hypothetical protein